MRIVDNELKNKTIDYDKLLKYGFTKENEMYLYKTKIYDEQFEMNVIVENNKITSKLIDLMNEEEYILVDIKDTAGEFVGKVREEYEKELQNIITKCTTQDIFKSEQAKEVIKYVKEKYNDDLEYLWNKFPENAVWRNKINNKDKMVDIIDLRYSKDKIKEIVDNEKIFEGYHMNKNSWITIRLDGSLETDKICELIDNSYNISLTK